MKIVLQNCREVRSVADHITPWFEPGLNSLPISAAVAVQCTVFCALREPLQPEPPCACGSSCPAQSYVLLLQVSKFLMKHKDSMVWPHLGVAVSKPPSKASARIYTNNGQC